MKIAITGTIGSGKTTVSDYIRQSGYDVFSCDQYNSGLLKEGSAAYPDLKKNFPSAFDGDTLNRQKMAKIVFGNEDKRKLLESILHPLILKEMLKRSESSEPFFAEVPLLFETGQQKYFDKSVLVVADEEIALKRLMDRGLDREDALARIDNQMSVSDKKKSADEIIYNNSDLVTLKRETVALLDKYVR